LEVDPTTGCLVTEEEEEFDPTTGCLVAEEKEEVDLTAVVGGGRLVKEAETVKLTAVAEDGLFTTVEVEEEDTVAAFNGLVVVAVDLPAVAATEEEEEAVLLPVAVEGFGGRGLRKRQ
jgi:predicted metalloprotease with PDZ domain